MEYPTAYRRNARVNMAGLSNAHLTRLDTLTFEKTIGGVPRSMHIIVLVPHDIPPLPPSTHKKKSLVPRTLTSRRGLLFRSKLSPSVLNATGKLLEELADVVNAVTAARVNSARLTPYATACGNSTEIPFVPAGLRELYGAACTVLRGINGPDPYTVGPYAAEYEGPGENVGFGLYEWTRIRTYEVADPALGPVEWPAIQIGVAPQALVWPEADPETLPVGWPQPRPNPWPLRARRPVTAPRVFGWEAGNYPWPAEPPLAVVQTAENRTTSPRLIVWHGNTKPPKGYKQAKLKLSFRGTTLGIVLNTLTEGVDLVNALWMAIPAHLRGANTLTPQQKLWEIYIHFHDIVWYQALQNIAYTALIDMIYGSIGNALAQATAGNPYWVGITGPQAGPVDHPPVVHGVGGPDWIPDLFPLNH